MNQVEELISTLCPDGVALKTVGELCQIKTGKKDVNQGNPKGLYPFFTCSRAHTYSDTYSFDCEALLVAGNGDVGLVQYFKGKFEAYQRTYVLMNFVDIHVQFLGHYLKAFLVGHLSALKQDGTIPYIKLGMLKDFEIPVPPLEIQAEIVRILDTFSKLEAELEAELEARKSQLQYYTARIFESEKYNFEKRKLGEIARCYAGATPLTTRRDYWEGGTIPWIASGEVNKGTIYNSESFITENGYKFSSTKMVPSGSVLIALAGQGKTRGMVARIRLDACTNQSLCAIVPYQDVNPDYLYFYMRTQYLKYRSMSSGEGGRGGLNLQIVKSIEIPLPSKKHQLEIVEILEKFDQLSQGVSSSLPAEIAARHKQYEYYRNKLLTFKELEVI